MSPPRVGVFDGRAERKKVAAVQAVLANRFHRVSNAVLSYQARALLATAQTAGDLTTSKAGDAKAVQRLILILRGADELVQGLSKPTREAVSHRMYMAGCRLSLAQLAGIVDAAAGEISKTPFSSRENVRAIFLVEDARRVWSENLGKLAPESGLNRETSFADFLAELFQALGVGAEPRSAFQAWHKYREDGVF